MDFSKVTKDVVKRLIKGFMGGWRTPKNVDVAGWKVRLIGSYLVRWPQLLGFE